MKPLLKKPNLYITQDALCLASELAAQPPAAVASACADATLKVLYLYRRRRSIRPKGTRGVSTCPKGTRAACSLGAHGGNLGYTEKPRNGIVARLFSIFEYSMRLYPGMSWCPVLPMRPSMTSQANIIKTSPSAKPRKRGTVLR